MFVGVGYSSGGWLFAVANQRVKRKDVGATDTWSDNVMCLVGCMEGWRYAVWEVGLQVWWVDGPMDRPFRNIERPIRVVCCAVVFVLHTLGRYILQVGAVRFIDESYEYG